MLGKGTVREQEGGLTTVLLYMHNLRMMGLFGTANQVIVCLTETTESNWVGMACRNRSEVSVFIAPINSDDIHRPLPRM